MMGDFIIEDGVLLKYNGSSTSIEIPDGVRVIGPYVFLGSEITSVTMPDTVIEIGDKAFHECGELRYVRLSKNVEKIGYCSFCGNAVKKIKIPASVKYIGWGAFCDYRTESLTELVFLKSSKLEKVESRAFGMHPMLKQVTIPLKLKGAFAEDAFDETCEIIWK